MLIAVFLSCRACKPNFVCRSFFPLGRRVPHTHSRCSNVWDASPARTKSGTTVIPLGRASLRGSSDLPGSCDAPSQHVRPPKRTLLPYLVLLHVGFSLPPPLLAARCALTAPFHPYPACAGRYVFCGTFRQRRLNDAARTLSGTLLCGVRTFLCLPAQPDLAEAPPKRTTSVRGTAATVRPSS